MKKLFLSFFVLFALMSPLKGNEYPHIAVVHTDADHMMMMSVTEKAAANIFYQMYPDVFDFLIFYTTFVPQLNMQQGLPVTYTVEGISREGFNPYGPASAWGSAGRLLGAAKMCNINQYPLEPDGLMAFPLAGLTHTELLAHEMGHYWHAAMNFKKDGMSEDHTGLRGWEGSDENASANQHWSGDFNSGPSVMYGADITDNGDGTFTYDPKKPRKWGPLDQYVMGLIPPEEMGELFFLCSSPNIENCREGNPSLPTPKTASPAVRSNMSKHVVTIDDIVRAMGERKPHFNEAQKHFNIGFVLVNKPGFWPLPDQLEKLEKTRVRFQEWWTWATDGRSTICTRLDGDCSDDNNEEPDDTEYADDVYEYPDETTVIPDDSPVVEQPDEKEYPDESVEVDDPKPDEKAEEKDDPPYSYDDEVGCSCGLVY